MNYEYNRGHHQAVISPFVSKISPLVGASNWWPPFEVKRRRCWMRRSCFRKDGWVGLERLASQATKGGLTWKLESGFSSTNMNICNLCRYAKYLLISYDRLLLIMISAGWVTINLQMNIQSSEVSLWKVSDLVVHFRIPYPLVFFNSYWTWSFIVDLPIENGDVP